MRFYWHCDLDDVGRMKDIKIVNLETMVQEVRCEGVIVSLLDSLKSLTILSFTAINDSIGRGGERDGG